MASWDRFDGARRDELVRRQLRDAVGPFSPYWRQRLRELQVSPAAVGSAAVLAQLPAVGERDVSPAGDPAAMAGLVLQATESGFALHASGPAVRRALLRRLVAPDAYREVVEADTRPTSFTWTGLGFRWPLASTRGDLDVVARAGRRLWGVLGLTGRDSLVSAVPVGRSTEHTALEYAALAAGAPALFPGPESGAVAEALRLAPATVLAVPSAEAADLVDDLASAGVALAGLRRLLLVGAPTDGERRAAAEALRGAGSQATAHAVHAPSGARWLWGECAPEAGLHTYPDLDVVQLVDPETAEPAVAAGPAELALTQLGVHGSALLRWRTGDVVDAPLADGPCPSCRRLVPRVPVPRRGALVVGGLDLRAVSGALAGRPEVADWRTVVRRSGPAGGSVAVHLLAAGDADAAVAAACADVAAAAGRLPAELTAVPAGGALPAVDGSLGARTGAVAGAVRG